jgi:hypothetical protein
MRVENRASVAHAAEGSRAYAVASARSVRRVSCRPRLRGKKKRLCGRAAHRTLGLHYALFARHAGSHDAHKATARRLMRALGKSLRRAPTP